MAKETRYVVYKMMVGEVSEEVGRYRLLADARNKATETLGVPLQGRRAKREKYDDETAQWLDIYIQPMRRARDALLGEIPAQVTIEKDVYE